MWVILAIISSFFLGIYDFFKKLSVKDNAVIPVIFFANLTGAVIFLPLIILSAIGYTPVSESFLYIPPVYGTDHLYFLSKAILVGGSWIFAYMAMKNLPITIVTPIRATGPVWTLIGALIIFGERLNLWQWVGLAITLVCFYLFSLAGLKEGIQFRKNKWIMYIVAATLLGAASGLFDKFLVSKFDKMAIQAWFAIYLVVIYLPVTIILWFPRRKQAPFTWRHSIMFIGIFLVIADFAYFYALSQEGALIALISALRRGSVAISFLCGAIFLKEVNLKHKGLALAGILMGVLLIVLSSYL